MKHIRNFCIIAHIDHGKSTLADRILELTNTIDKRTMHDQFLDYLEIEKERSITIKLSAVRINYWSKSQNQKYTLNLIDTPGHVDFTYEVSRSMAACEGAILVVDATQGIQAQTLSNTYLAIENNLVIVPVINKIDLPSADVAKVEKQIEDLLGIKAQDIVKISAKTGQNVEQVLDKIITHIPAPQLINDQTGDKAIVFDSYYDAYRGAVLFVRVFQGHFKLNEKIILMATNKTHQITSLGVRAGEEIQLTQLQAGEVGWIAAGVKDIHEINIGDTVTTVQQPALKPLPGYRELKPMVYGSLFPVDSKQYTNLEDALLKISLSDASLQYEPESSQALGFGFRCGFLGLLHMEIIRERLEKEYNLELISTAPSVKYQIQLTNQKLEYISNPAHWPATSKIKLISEPIVEIKIYTTSEYVGNLTELCHSKRGVYKAVEYATDGRQILIYEMPLSEIIFDFFNKLKSISRGYASFDYEFIEYRAAKLVKLDVWLNKISIDALSLIVHRDAAYKQARILCLKLKEVIPSENFEVPIQAVINSKIIARETIKASRKNVTAGLYGGDISRKKKVLARQKKGKKQLKLVGKVHVPKEAFLTILKADN